MIRRNGSSSLTKKKGNQLRATAGILMVQILLAAVALSLLNGPAVAGTETGEFCPTCPDWSNLEGWLSQKEAYEKAQQQGSEPVKNVNSSNKEVEVAKSYPLPEVLTYAVSPLSSWVVIDVRTPDDYKNGHIPGARNIYWKDTQTKGALDLALTESELRKVGINNSDNLLIYGGSDDGAPYVFWALSYMGHKNLSKLDGGIDAAWSAGIKPDKSIPVVKKSNYTIHVVPWLKVNETTLPEWLNRSDLQILDARDFTDYGRSRLTNAAIPFGADKLYDESKIQGVRTLEDMFGRRGLNKNGIQLVYGTPAAYSLFYGLRLMGYNATLLEGSWWSGTRWAVSNIR